MSTDDRRFAEELLSALGLASDQPLTVYLRISFNGNDATVRVTTEGGGAVEVLKTYRMTAEPINVPAL